MKGKSLAPRKLRSEKGKSTKEKEAKHEHQNLVSEVMMMVARHLMDA